jgi:hypothetical protein
VRRFVTISLLVLAFAQLCAQALPERKILIRDGQFWYTTVHEMFQVATLHTGSVTDPLVQGKQLALPAGRNYMEPVIPFAWDLAGDDLYCINFLDHPLNDRNEAIKRIELATLPEESKAPNTIDRIMLGAEMTPFVANDPYVWMQRRNNVFDHFCFDMLLDEKGHLRMAISNQGEMTLWTHNGKEWEHTAPFPFQSSAAFSLFRNGKDLCLLGGDGALHQWNGDKLERIPAKASAQALTDGVIVVNDDDHSVRFLPNSHFDTDLPLKAIIENYAIRIL